MKLFLCFSAEQMLKRQINKCDDAKTQFDAVLEYFDATNIEEKVQISNSIKFLFDIVMKVLWET